MTIRPWGFLAGVALLAACSRLSFAATITADVAFKVGENASIRWFEIANPAVGGTISVANPPYPSTDALNSAVVDISRNRLMYIDDSHSSTAAFAFSLANLQLIPNAATQVTASSLGSWPGGNDNASYSKADGQVYYHVYNAIELRYLNFDSSGNIAGFTTVGTLNGSSFTTPSIRGGDIDFDSSGTLWVSGINSGSNPRLWSFNPTTLTVMRNVNPAHASSGLAFDVTGTTLYGYSGDTGQYGIVDQNTGNFQTVLATDSTLFGDSGDLAEAMQTIVVPEPSSLAIMLAAVVAIRGQDAGRRRREGGRPRPRHGLHRPDVAHEHPKVNCPKCGRLLSAEGEIVVGGRPDPIPVYSCPECVMRRAFGGGSMRLPLMFMLGPDGKPLDPAIPGGAIDPTRYD